MNLLHSIRSLFTPSRKSAPDPSVWLRGDDLDTGEGAKLLSPYSQSAWVYIAVSVLAENVAQIPFRISKIPATARKELVGTRPIATTESRSPSPLPSPPGEGEAAADVVERVPTGTPPLTLFSPFKKILGENIIERGPVIDLFNHPHPSMDRSLFFETIMTWRSLRGEFFILPLDSNDQPVDLSQTRNSKPETRNSPITRLITLPPDNFWHIVQGYDLAGWRFTGSPLASPIQSQVLLPSEVIHSRSPNPYLFWRGMSPLVVAMLPAAADYAAEQFMKGLMINNADTGVIVTTDQQPTTEQQEQFRAALRERKRKAGTADRPLFLWGGAKVEKPSVTSADMQFLENRKLNRQEIGAIFKVPESMMGFTESKAQLGGGGGSTVEAEKLNFIHNTLTPHSRRIEAALEPIIKSFHPDLCGWFDIEGLPIMQEARRLRLDSALKAFSLAVPLNVINSVYDLGFPAVPWGNKAYLPANLQEVGSAPFTEQQLTSDADPDAGVSDTISFERLLKLAPEILVSDPFERALKWLEAARQSAKPPRSAAASSASPKTS